MPTVSELTMDIGGASYIIASDDDYPKKTGAIFEPDTVELLRTAADQSEVSLDIGANIGCTAILLSQFSKQVHAFEPSPSTFKFLQHNVQRSGAENIHLHNFGLGSEYGKYPLTFAPADRAGGFVSDQVRAGADHATENVVIHKLDDVVKTLALKRLDFIKIDVEGFEAHVIRGADDTLRRFQPVIAMELNHWCLNAFQRTSVPDFLDQLRTIFPILYAVDGSSYLDIHDESHRFLVMYHNITKFRFMDILAAFREDQVERFISKYRRG